jgi:subtilisin family serine protease
MRLNGTSMSTAVVSGGVALLLQAEPSMSPAQVKMAVQMGARFLPKDGLIAGGTGAVNFAQSMTVLNNGLLDTLLTTVTSLLGSSSGAYFRDNGTLIDRVYDRTGINLLRILDLGALFRDADDAEFGVLNLLGTSNPMGSAGANYVVWGNVADWSSSYYVVWGNTIQSPDGQYVVWGNNEYSETDYVVWGNTAGGGQ